MDKLEPCPFCGVEMQLIRDSGVLAFTHPMDDCVLRNKAWYFSSDAAKWNRRTPAKHEAE